MEEYYNEEQEFDINDLVQQEEYLEQMGQDYEEETVLCDRCGQETPVSIMQEGLCPICYEGQKLVGQRH